MGFLISSGRLLVTLSVMTCAATLAGSEQPCEPEPRDAAEWTLRGDCLRLQERPEDAVGAYQEALRLEPEGFRALFYGLGLAYVDLDRGGSALWAFQLAEDQGGPDAELHYHIGIAHELILDYDAALKRFRLAIALRPDDNRAQRNIGFVLINQGKPEDAIQFLREAIRIDRNDHKAWVNLGLAYMDVENSIRRDLKAMAPMPPGPVDPDDPDYQLRQAMIAKLHGFDWFDESIAALQEAVSLKPSVPVYWYNLGTAFYGRRKDEQAIEALSRAAELDPDYYKALRNLALAQERVQSYEDSYETCLRIKELADGHVDPWLEVQLADLERILGRLEVSGERYRAVLETDPNDVDAHIGLAIVYHRQGRTVEAQQHLDRGIELRPDLKRVFEHAVEQSD